MYIIYFIYQKFHFEVYYYIQRLELILKLRLARIKMITKELSSKHTSFIHFIRKKLEKPRCQFFKRSLISFYAKNPTLELKKQLMYQYTNKSNLLRNIYFIDYLSHFNYLYQFLFLINWIEDKNYIRVQIPDLL